MTVDPAGVRPASPLRRLPRLAVIVLVGLFIALLAYGLSAKAPDDSIDQRLADGRTAPAPAFSLDLLERGVLPKRLGPAFGRAAADRRIALDELGGSPVVINFWASWCSPCREEAGVLEAGWQRWGRRGVFFLGIDIQDVRGDASSFLDKHGITYPTIRDSDKDVATDFGATGIPETYFVSPAGRVVAHVVGVVSQRQLDIGAAAAREGRVAGKERGGAIRKPR
jgi:cytochrome c biogenesis protein CcmG, thiol:disulfide interchange protein DsbE